MNEFIKKITPQNYTLSAVIVGLVLCIDLDFDQQNLLGGWLMLIGQLIQTNAGLASLQDQGEKNESKKAEVKPQQNEKQPQQSH